MKAKCVTTWFGVRWADEPPEIALVRSFDDGGEPRLDWMPVAEAEKLVTILKGAIDKAKGKGK